MTSAWMLCLLGTAALSTLMAFNGTWRRHPALFVYLGLITAQSLACWALWTSHWYCVAYYGIGALAQLTQLWIMVELSTQVTAASPNVKRLLRHAIPTFALITLLWVSSVAPEVPKEYPSFVRIASHLDTAVSLSWAATLVTMVVLVAASGCQFSQGARGIASGFLLEILTSNLTAYLYVNSPNASWMNLIKQASYGATILIWAVSLARPRGAKDPVRLYASPHALKPGKETWAND